MWLIAEIETEPDARETDGEGEGQPFVFSQPKCL